MQNKIDQFKVSCSGWEVEVDSESFESAAISGLIAALKTFGSDLLLSTTIMVTKQKNSTKTSLESSDFFSTQKILDKIGLNSLSYGLDVICKSKLERVLSVES